MFWATFDSIPAFRAHSQLCMLTVGSHFPLSAFIILTGGRVERVASAACWNIEKEFPEMSSLAANFNHRGSAENVFKRDRVSDINLSK